jgi:hypothetical protein
LYISDDIIAGLSRHCMHTDPDSEHSALSGYISSDEESAEGDGYTQLVLAGTHETGDSNDGNDIATHDDE